MTLTMQIERIAPIGFNGDSRNPFWNIVITALSKHSAAFREQVLVFIGTVGKVASRLPVRIESVAQALIVIVHRSYFPACHHLVGIVAIIASEVIS